MTGGTNGTGGTGGTVIKSVRHFFNTFGHLEQIYIYESRQEFCTIEGIFLGVKNPKKWPRFQKKLHELTQKKWHNFENISFYVFYG